jgi:tetraprenyl-beta-curcumene synthase
VFRLVSRSRSWLAFVAAACTYWLSAFPDIRRETCRWEDLARTIPDPSLRHLALAALRGERGNLEGAGAFATFSPRPHRAGVLTGVVAFQAVYDYVDALSEQPSLHPAANTRRLHDALLTALGHPSAADYYRHSPKSDDGRYLRTLVQTCWSAVRELPSYGAVADATHRAAMQMVIYQSLNLSEYQGAHTALERWGKARTPAGSGLRWWETAAAAGSSLLVFALIAAAGAADLDKTYGELLTRAYFPWIGALHILLDGLIDRREDVRSGRGTLMAFYSSPQQAACRIGWIAERAMRHALELPDGIHHSLILAGMTSFYLAGTPPDSTYVQLARPLVLRAMGELARPSMFVMGTRRALRG